MAEAALPEVFQDLEPWKAWSLETEKERSDMRQASSMDELRAFYDAALARVDDALSYLEQFPLESMPADARRLFLLTLSLAEVAPAIEQFGQVAVVDGYDAQRFVAERRE
jgi:hypothetical protein